MTSTRWFKALREEHKVARGKTKILKKEIIK